MKAKICLKLSVILYLFLLLIACDQNKNIDDPKQLGEAYCNCLLQNKGEKDPIYARIVCDGELIKKSRFFRLDKVNLQYIDSAEKVPDATIDSVNKFMIEFMEYRRQNCCSVWANCPGKIWR